VNTLDNPNHTTLCTTQEALELAEATGKAVDVSWNDEDGSCTTAYPGGHLMQSGGRDGDGYCYGHQSFDCLGSDVPV
jgi:hypothetical protein